MALEYGKASQERTDNGMTRQLFSVIYTAINDGLGGMYWTNNN